MSQQQGISTGLSKINNAFFPMIESQLTGNGISMDGYAKQCVLSAISAINNALDSKGISWNDSQLDKNNITQILLSVASLKLNAAASPREVYFQTRNTSVKAKDEQGKEITIWKKQVEMGIEGDGNDAILARFGRNVEKVYPYWVVREGDHFEYPKFRGVEYEPPVWEQTGKGDVIRIVYPILHSDKTLHYYIAERDDVVKNLIAHVNNNMMNETFGILPYGKKRFDASPEQLKQITAKKNEILKRVKELGLDALDDPDLQQWISPAWTDFHSRESMIIRKMRNNIAKKIPKDFGSAFVEMIHSEATDESYVAVRQEIAENANRDPIDIKPEPPKADPAPKADVAPQTPPTPQQETVKPVSDPVGAPPLQQQDMFAEQAAAGAAGPDW